MRFDFLRTFLVGLTAWGLVGLASCKTSHDVHTSFAPANAQIPSSGPTFLEPSDVNQPESDIAALYQNLSPENAIDYNNVEYQGITLEECVTRALSSSEVFRELGGVVVNLPSSIQTSLDPALQFSDPLAGEEAALSAFDAEFSSSFNFEKNDRPFNNLFSGQDGLFVQDLISGTTEINKLTAAGTLFTSRSTINYDANNQTANRFGSTWEAILDSGFRHPLLQGSGTLFNRIAGPGNGPGVYNGVLIARTNTEISLADFEDSVREFISNVENAYWDLYYAYRELEAQTAARDAAAKVAQKTRAQEEEGRIGELELASAEEQLLRFEASIVESLEGRLIDGTQTNSGTSGGTFLRTIGVRTAERRLRYLLGMPITDGVLLKPSEQPIRTAIAFDWQSSINSALNQRPETRRQNWIIRQRQLELTAAKNFLLPRLDLVGNYRFRGRGQQLAGQTGTFSEDVFAGASSSATANSSALSDFFNGNFQEVQFGAELTLPVGFRQANAAVRTAELNVQRERAILKEQERKIVLDLSNVFAECRRAFNAMQVAQRRYDAAVDYRNQAQVRVENGRIQYDVLLEAQRRILESQIQFINAEVEYALAIKNVHFERATYLGYHGIRLSESQSDPEASTDHNRRLSRLTRPLNYTIQDPIIGQSRGPQTVIGGAVVGDIGGGAVEGSAIDLLPIDGGEVIVEPAVVEPLPYETTISDDSAAVEAVPASTVPAPPAPTADAGGGHVYRPKFLPPPTKPLAPL